MRLIEDGTVARTPASHSSDLAPPVKRSLEVERSLQRTYWGATSDGMGK